MGMISTEFYWTFLCFFMMLFTLPILLHIHWLYDDHEKNFYSSLVILLYYLPTYFAIKVKDRKKLLPTAEWFVRHRYMLAGAMIALNILMIVNSVIRLVGLWENVSVSISLFSQNIVVTCMLVIVIMYIPISIFFHCADVELRFSHLKSTKLSKKQWLVLFGFHTLLAALYATLFLFDGSSLGKEELVLNFRLVRCFCQVLNILSIPMSYQAILLWNSDNLRFKGKYPNTTRNWTGLMKKNPDGTWEIDQSPEDHNISIV
ncbi:hypothetical protein CRE_24623 [Caenorhabditis remanei]|uniref:Uncharacterized protein n=1 Tax=Caenorhabditis remanei TaxID=31234 RepID=E3MVH2_CAERE|nr:hypothetical protein CRE_24623 [Caenorhabditis remanei]